jgi:hypothetical protein
VKAVFKPFTTATAPKRGDPMLGIIALVLVILWAMGFLAFHVTTGFIHLLLVIAVITFIAHLVTGRAAV